MSIWDTVSIDSGDYVKFERVGDSVSGTVKAIGTHTFPATADGPEKTVPQLAIVTDDGQERTMTAGQVRLLAALAEQRPEVGDHLTVAYVREEPRGGGKKMKHFDVNVTRGAGGAPAAASAPAPAPAAAGSGWSDEPPF